MSTMSSPRSEISGSTALPETDESRLMFYAEVLMANVPSLIADLSSAKYAFLSFSEKTRNEVKQKSALIQSIGRTFTLLQNASKSLIAARQSLQEYETRLVRAAPPTFVTSAEALHLSSARAHGDTTDAEQNGNASAEATAAALRRLSTASLDNLVILDEEDIRPVREAEEAYEKESTASAEIARACNKVEDAFDHAHDQCRMMTEHVQDLKWKFDEVYNGWKSVERERLVVRVMRDELEDRRAIMTEALHGIKAVEEECRAQELRIIEVSIAHAQAETVAIKAELQAKRSRYELELATYQIAYKEQQAEVEALREHCKLLRSHQRDLEILAKKQQIEEMNRNCLRKLMMATLTLTPSKCGKAEDRTLTSEQQMEVRNDHLLVSVLAARISILEEQRRTVGVLLASARGMGKSDDDSATVEQIRTLLEPEVQLDEDALTGD
ncbi:conserved hypothetical protein [Leishmania major strain Friedlin]|uniref:Uncharacterized protein n=1 Tax=Leishmania major TaxID=5664 RepID=Q4Q799_LEIMA|nr:conserved hypothetical protein [Leishmania major strain Friedlin]CAG9578428.1 hypothetical_protein_-_conserved [Leishmania major strain Friedlin]CAJ06371.1 conserved hypothetical protein [Leishmania major strain Friedlin]|eukprot:XP_001684799.1 conserved hypothetical protein [Leishmania major strain Friedlin]